MHGYVGHVCNVTVDVDSLITERKGFVEKCVAFKSFGLGNA